MLVTPCLAIARLHLQPNIIVDLALFDLPAKGSRSEAQAQQSIARLLSPSGKQFSLEL